jgi:hypothetical protein
MGWRTKPAFAAAANGRFHSSFKKAEFGEEAWVKNAVDVSLYHLTHPP